MFSKIALCPHLDTLICKVVALVVSYYCSSECRAQYAIISSNKTQANHFKMDIRATQRTMVTVRCCTCDQCSVRNMILRNLLLIKI